MAPQAAARAGEEAWRSPRLTVDGIVPLRGGVLLVRRARPPFEGAWVLPGGFVEHGEDPREAVVREVEEEAGLRCRVARLVGVYGAPGRDPRGHTVTIVYELEALAGEPRAASDAAEARAWPLDALPGLGFDHARILADWRRGAGPRG